MSRCGPGVVGSHIHHLGLVIVGATPGPPPIELGRFSYDSGENRLKRVAPQAHYDRLHPRCSRDCRLTPL